MKARNVATAPLRGLKALSSMVFAQSAGLVWRLLPNTRFNYRAEVGDGTGSSLVMAPILWIARTFPEAPPQVLDSDGAPVERHPMTQLLRRPNRFYSGIVLWMATLLSWVVDGNAYWLKIRNGAGGVAELWYVPHWMIEARSDRPDTLITHYEYLPDGRPIRVDVENVVHFRYGLNPSDPRKGLSPLGSVLREIFSDDEAANFAAALLRNVGVPGLIVSPDSDQSPTPDDVKAVKGYVDQEFTGDNRGRPLVMSGRTKVHQFGFSPEQMGVRGLRRVPEERVTAVIGLPAIVCGLGAGLERSTFANYAEAREAAWEDNIIPTQRMFGEELRHQLLPDFEDRPDMLDVGWDRSGVRVLQEDRNKEATRLVELYQGGVITRAEARKPLGEDVTDADDVYAVPLSTLLVPAGVVRELPAPPPVRELPPGDAKARGVKAATAASDTVDGLRRDGVVLQAVLAEELEAELEALGRECESAFLMREPKAAGNGNGATKAQEDDDDEETVAAVLRVAAVATWVRRKLGPMLERHYRRTVRRTTETISGALGETVELSERAVAEVVALAGRRAGMVDIEGQTRDAILRAIADGREQGLNPRETARAIRSQVPAGPFPNAGPRYRAELIARTETLHAQRASSLATYREAEVVAAVVAFDGTGDAECEARNGREFTFDEADAEMAATHPNCVLAFGPVVRASVAPPPPARPVAA